MNDIAIVLFYAVVGHDSPEEFVYQFMEPFLEGYSKENAVDTQWLERIPLFLKLREIDLYAVIHRSFDVDNLEDRWVSSYMEGRKEKILGDVPFVDFDWKDLAQFCS